MSIQEKREYMLSMIADWQQSGKSKKTYCAENGINEAKFYYWISRVKEIDKSAVGFLTIDKASKNSDIEIIYPNGVLSPEYSLTTQKDLPHAFYR